LLRLVWSQDFGTSDPIFHRDVGFYLFVLPILDLVQGGLELLIFAGLLLLGFAYYATGAVQISCSRGAVTSESAGPRGDLFDHLRAHVLELVGKFDLLGDGDAVLGDARGAERFVEDDVAALWAQRTR
jgi:uncharacterized membrane protein (UPF0182 family)